MGSGLESTSATIALTRRVADLGADAVLVLTPHYYRPQMTSEALRRHYEAVAEASPVPVLLYSVPQYTGLPIAPELSAGLAAHPRIAGIKDSSGDIGALSKLLAAAPPGFRVVCGSAPVLYPRFAWVPWPASWRWRAARRALPPRSSGPSSAGTTRPPWRHSAASRPSQRP